MTAIHTLTQKVKEILTEFQSVNCVEKKVNGDLHDLRANVYQKQEPRKKLDTK